MKRYVLIVAGGKGLRMKGDLPKQFIPLNGKPVLMHTMERFYQWDSSVEIILVLAEEHHAYWNMLCKELDCKVPFTMANGGETRFHSVRNGLALITQEGLIAVHDGVRPFVSMEVIDNCFKIAESEGSAVPVVPIVDSIREIKEEGGSTPVNRDKFVIVQTPQVFKSSILLESYEALYESRFTDDASVVETKGYTISMVQGNKENIKITTPADLLIAELFLRKENP